MLLKDQLGREINLQTTPKRIVSLVPSQTEFLHDLGLTEEVIGITKFCIYPQNWFESKARVGGTKNVDLQKIKLLNPDLIIGNKEENTESDIIALEEISPVWISDIYTLTDSYEMMKAIGQLVGSGQKASEIIDDIKFNFENFIKFDKVKTAMYLIWNEPIMAAAKNTFIDTMLTEFGLRNFYENHERYPICIPDVAYFPDYIFLSSEPFPFKEQHKIKVQKLYPKSKIIFVDGEIFSWYGSRLKFAPAYFEKLKKELA